MPHLNVVARYYRAINSLDRSASSYAKKKGKKKKKRKKEKGKKKRRDVGIKNAEISVIKAANEMTPCIHLMDQFIRDWTRIEFLETFRFGTI